MTKTVFISNASLDIMGRTPTETELIADVAGKVSRIVQTLEADGVRWDITYTELPRDYTIILDLRRRVHAFKMERMLRQRCREVIHPREA